VIAAGLALAAGALIGSYDLMLSIHRMRVEQGQHYSSRDHGWMRHGANGELSTWIGTKLL
jgi:hypothetical protein